MRHARVIYSPVALRRDGFVLGLALAMAALWCAAPAANAKQDAKQPKQAKADSASGSQASQNVNKPASKDSSKETGKPAAKSDKSKADDPSKGKSGDPSGDKSSDDAENPDGGKHMSLKELADANPLPRGKPIKGYEHVNFNYLASYPYLVYDPYLEEEGTETTSDLPGEKKEGDAKAGDKKDAGKSKPIDPDNGASSNDAPGDAADGGPSLGLIPQDPNAQRDAISKAKDPANMTPKERNARANLGDKQIPKDIAKLHGKKIRVVGYMVPIEFKEGTTNEFVLIRVIPSCFYCQKPQVNDWIEIKVKGGKRFEVNTIDPVQVHGEFIVGAKHEDGILTSIYRMKADGVIALEGDAAEPALK